MTSATKTHLQAELDDYRASCHELRHFLIPEVLRILEDPFRVRAIPGCDVAERLRAWIDAPIMTAEDRAGLPLHSLGVSTRAERSRGGITAPDWRYARQDGAALDSCVRTNCQCGELVYLLSVPKRTGGYFTARADSDGFTHRCEESPK